VHGDALYLFIGQGKPYGLDTATAMVGRWRSLEASVWRRSLLPRISSDAREVGRGSECLATSGACLSTMRSWPTGSAALSSSETTTVTLFLHARFLKQAKRYLDVGWTAPGLWHGLLLGWLRAAAVLRVGCGGPGKFPSISHFKFYLLFLFTDLHLLFDFKFELCLVCRF
jgi:hypothetical protein